MMEETKTASHKPPQDAPLVHRVCEACNNMFAVQAGAPDRRCPKCRKE